MEHTNDTPSDFAVFTHSKTIDVLVLYENPAGNRQVSIRAVVQQGADLQVRTA
jgi:hypothetical protein